MSHPPNRAPRHARPIARSLVKGNVTSIVAGGKALLRDDEGVLFARGGLVGEQVEVEIERRSGGTRHGVVVRVIDPSPERVAPDCRLHPRCGGCDLLDLSARAQHTAKFNIVRDALARIARLPEEQLRRLGPLLAPDDGRGLRRRARLVIDQGSRPAFYARESHARLPIERCPALSKRLEEALRALAMHKLLEPGVPMQIACDERDIATGVLVVDDDDRVLVTAGDPTLQGEVAPGVAGGPYLSDAATFTQATRFGGRAILDEVLRAVQPTAGMRVLELFAGSGHLTLPLAHGGADVVAVEGAPHGVRWLEANRAASGFGDRIQVRRAFIDGALPLEGQFDVVVADPPRTGIVGFEALLPRTRASRVVLVSCDPATGARDLAKAAAGGYELQWLTPIDAFPRTSHVEWVALLARRA